MPNFLVLCRWSAAMRGQGGFACAGELGLALDKETECQVCPLNHCLERPGCRSSLPEHDERPQDMGKTEPAS